MFRSAVQNQAKSWHRSDNLYLDWVTKREKLIGRCVTTSHYLQEQLELTAKEQPHLPCIKTKTRTYTYGEIDEWSNQRARLFAQFGIGRNDHVGILSKNSASYMVSILAAIKLNAAGALLNKNLRGEALKYAVGSGDIKLLHIDDADSSSEAILDLGLDVPVLSEHQHLANGHQTLADEGGYGVQTLPIESRLPTDKMALIYTSGTTGYPKPAVYSYGANLWASSLGIMLNWGTDSTIFTGCPMFHTVGSMMSGTGAMWNGSAFAFQENFSASQFMADANAFNTTTFSYIGEMMRYVSKTDVKSDESVNTIQSAFGPGLRPDIWKALLSRFGPIHFAELYGSSEGIVGLYNIDPDDVGIICRFTPTLQDLTQSRLFRYDEESGQVLRHAASGRGLIAGPNEPGILCAKILERRKFNGYYKAKAKTQEKILSNMTELDDEWFNTGDAFSYDDQYRLKFLDRTGDTYRWKGENTSTEEVTNILSSCSSVVEACVYGVEIPGHDGKAGMAAIVGEINEETLAEILSKLEQNLQSQSIPIFYRQVDSIPKTANFKAKKVELATEGYNGDNTMILHQGKFAKLTDDVKAKLSGMKL